MEARGEGHALLDRDIEAALAGPGAGIGRQRSGAVVVALLDPLRVVWANKPATRLFETDDANDLSAKIFAGRGREGLGASIGRLAPDGAPRLDRLRLIRGFQSRTTVVTLSRSRLPDGRGIVVLTMPGHETGEHQDDYAVPGLRARSAVFPTGDDATPATAAPPPEGGHGRPDAAPAPVSHKVGPELTEGLRARLSGLRPVRLLWQTDAAHRLVKLTGGAAELAGVAPPTFLGQLFPAALDSADADHGRLGDLMDARSPWTGLRVRWPLSQGPATVAVTLGAVPQVGRSGDFDGFRGFGIVDFADLRVAPEAAEAPQPGHGVAAPAEPASAEPVGDARPRDRPPGDDAPSAALRHETRTTPPALPSAIGTTAAGIEPPAEDPVGPTQPPGGPAPERSVAFSPKVVSLRHYQTFSPSTPPGAARPPRPPEAPPAPVEPEKRADTVDDERPNERVDLTTDERSNFDEIGRALLGVQAADPQPRAGADAGPVLDMLGEAVLVAGPEGVRYANPSFLALTRYATREALGDAGGLPHLLAGLASEDLLGRADAHAFSVLGGDGEPIAVRGHLRPVAWDGSPAQLLTLRDAADRAADVQAVQGDIERHAPEISELRAMLDRVTESILTVDRKGRILTVNAAAERLFGYAPRQAVGEPLAMLVGPDAQVAVVDLDNAPDEGEAGLDVTGRTAAGKILSLRLSWHALGSGRFCVMFRDQQERSSLARGLAATQERLDRALSSKTEFLAKISHEIRTPLNAILGFAEVILEERFGPIGNDRYRSYIHDIHESGTSVFDLVNDLLDLSKMEAGRVDVSPTRIEVNRIVTDCVNGIQTAAHRERVIVRLSLLPDLAPALVDERAFRQIMGHVLSNAIKFNEPGGQVIVSTAMTDASAVAVRVRDTGVGMTESEIASAMEPFGLSRTAQAGGSGVGLPLARALVEANGATMSLRSQKNEGTLVELLLPSFPAEPMRVPAE